MKRIDSHTDITFRCDYTRPAVMEVNFDSFHFPFNTEEDGEGPPRGIGPPGMQALEDDKQAQVQQHKQLAQGLERVEGPGLELEPSLCR